MKIEEERHEQQISRSPQLATLGSDSARNDKGDVWRESRTQRWAAGWATAGAAAWAGVAVLARLGIARIGTIELMFLFAPLVIVPLGMELGRIGGSGSRVGRALAAMAQTLQPLGALLAVVAICLPSGGRAMIAAAGWMVVCGLMGTAGLVELGGIIGKSLSEYQIPEHQKVAGYLDQNLTAAAAAATRVGVVSNRLALIAGCVARVDLAVGGAWLVASRWGMHPMGIQEPIGLLTAVHFHFAGFATATIAGATLHFAEGRFAGRQVLLGWLRRVGVLVLAMPFLVAAGFVISARLKMVAALVFSAGVVGLAGFVWRCAGAMENRTARGMLRVVAGSVLGGMVLSGTYAVVGFLRGDLLTIPRMASTHGVLNAVGFCLFGLLGWLVEAEDAAAGCGDE